MAKSKLKIQVEVLTVSKKEYNRLCDLLRHLLTLSKKIDRRSDKLHEVIANLNDELKKERKVLISKVQEVEAIINKLILNELEGCDEN